MFKVKRNAYINSNNRLSTPNIIGLPIKIDNMNMDIIIKAKNHILPDFVVILKYDIAVSSMKRNPDMALKMSFPPVSF
jgi:hypothetical protein